MSPRVIGKRPDDLEAETLIEPGRLETVGIQHDLARAARDGFALRHPHQSRTEATPAMRLVNPQRPHVATAAPGPSVQAADDPIATVACQDGEQPSVVEPGSRGVELVEPIVEKLYDTRLGRVGQLNFEKRKKGDILIFPEKGTGLLIPTRAPMRRSLKRSIPSLALFHSSKPQDGA